MYNIEVLASIFHQPQLHTTCVPRQIMGRADVGTPHLSLTIPATGSPTATKVTAITAIDLSHTMKTIEAAIRR